MEWERVIEINPKYWLAYFNIAVIYFNNKDLNTAIKYWTKAFAIMLFG
jgi:tetratricopeptide (TPR) repeat protein